MKKSIKIISILVMALLVITTLSANVFAASDVLNKLEDKTKGATVDTTQIETTAGKVIKILQTIGIIVGVAVLVILGIKFMMGSAEEKAEYKKTLVPYVIGAGFVFAASTIAGVIYNFSKDKTEEK